VRCRHYRFVSSLTIPLAYRSYTDNDGQTRGAVEIVASDVQFLFGRKDAGHDAALAPHAQRDDAEDDLNLDKLPLLGKKQRRTETNAHPPRFTGYVRLESVGPGRNRPRYYVLHWQPLLWGGAALIRHWGRIGPRGRDTTLPVADPPQVTAAVQRLLSRRLRHGYRLVDWR
jgi:predicted DNA-binding WGR domain protein